MLKIALSGKMKSGKSTLANALGEHGVERSGRNHTLRTLSFADPIREALLVMNVRKEQHPDLYRQAAQYIGTELFRAYDPNWWVHIMRNEVEYNEEHGKHWYIGGIVIDDMRFENEYDYCKEAGFLMVRLDVSEETQLTRGAERGRLQHPSETGLDHIPKEGWDLWLPENTTIEDRVSLVLKTCLQSQNA